MRQKNFKPCGLRNNLLTKHSHLSSQNTRPTLFALRECNFMPFWVKRLNVAFLFLKLSRHVLGLITGPRQFWDFRKTLWGNGTTISKLLYYYYYFSHLDLVNIKLYKGIHTKTTLYYLTGHSHSHFLSIQIFRQLS